MTSVVSTVAGGLETPDFLELRKNSGGRATSEVVERDRDREGPRSLYQVVPEKQTNVRGLMGSERGYDVSAVSGAPIPVLGDDRGTKVCTNFFCSVSTYWLTDGPRILNSAKPTVSMSLSTHQNWKVCQRRSCGGSMMRILKGRLGCLVQIGRTFRIW